MPAVTGASCRGFWTWKRRRNFRNEIGIRDGHGGETRWRQIQREGKIHRGCQRLRARPAAAFGPGNAVEISATRSEYATATVEKPDGGKFNVKAKFIVDASGYGRVLPRLLDLETPSKFPQRDRNTRRPRWRNPMAANST